MNISPELLRSFVAVAERRSFTHAARTLGLQQSTVSQRIKRLEDLLRRPLLARNTHSVALTEYGDALIERARDVLAANGRLREAFDRAGPRGRLRLGVSEDFAHSGLAEVMASFVRRHPTVEMVLAVGLSGGLYEKLDAGELDVIISKRRRGDRRGQVVWRERLAWIGLDGIRFDPDVPLPLALHPPPSITRALALEALDRAGRDWRIACTSASLGGIHAAVRAGLGVAAHSAMLIPNGLSSVPTSRHMPELSEVEFVVVGAKAHGMVAEALVAAILRFVHASREAGATACRSASKA